MLLKKSVFVSTRGFKLPKVLKFFPDRGFYIVRLQTGEP